MAKERVLVVDDDPDMLETCADLLTRAGYDVLMAPGGSEAIEVIHKESVDVLLTDLKMPGEGGLEVLKAGRGLDPELVVILITAFPTVESAVEALKTGASDYVMKPFTGDQLLSAIDHALDRRRSREETHLLRSQLPEQTVKTTLIGRSSPMISLIRDVQKAAHADAPVLIMGESGTGKELIARSIHENSRRSDKPFVPVNCAAIPEGLLEGELFGFAKGAFTGAYTNRRGLLESTRGGAFFLDEMCELSPALQAKLLRVLEEKAVRPLGAQDLIPLDLRFVAATNRNIQEEIKEGRFREDLFFRISVLQIAAPPLRERVEDIPLLATYFLQQFSDEAEKTVEGISQDAMRVLCNYHWPGNVRELQNTIQRAVTYAQTPLITFSDLPEGITQSVTTNPETPNDFHRMKQETIDRFEKEIIEDSLKRSQGNITHAAESLGLHRSTLQRLIRKHGIEE